ncbi:MAG: histidinol-phosphate transaminase, partial [Alphaproteobacteria bacterium]|nr:histidinol-phosphate transaminase [Alphaproteobacteria bacterium]
EHGFAMYPIAARAAGAHPVVAPERAFTTDVDAILAAVTTRTKLVFVANPNNPTGTYISGEDLARLRERLPPGVLLIVDAAYAEYVGRNDYADGRELVEASGNTVMTRTFSKIYGLAALRLGWAYCPPNVVDVLQRVRGPFNVNAAAQAAGVAAIRDAEYVEFSRAHNDKWLPWLADEVRALGFEALPSVGNFILVRFSDVKAALAALERRGVITRRVAGYGFPDGLRITVGREEDNRAVITALGTLVS